MTVKKKYSTGTENILSTNPARPSNYCLSAFYGPSWFPFFNEAADMARAHRQFPGRY